MLANSLICIILRDQVWGPQGAQLKEKFQLNTIYVQVILHLDVNTLLIMKGFQLKSKRTFSLFFNSFECTFNGFSFHASRKNIQLKSTHLQLILIFCELIFLFNIRKHLLRKGFQLKSLHLQGI